MSMQVVVVVVVVVVIDAFILITPKQTLLHGTCSHRVSVLASL